VIEALNAFRNKVLPLARNIGGWCTKRKIVVIESDDWGSIRMPSSEVYNKLLKKGYRVDEIAYERYDSLASESDLECLFNLLKEVEDSRGTHPVMTANTIVTNPDFDKIRQSGFADYSYEPFTETLKRYPGHGRSIDLWKKGMSERLFYPQFHGREHVNVPRFMEGLRRGDSDLTLFFDHKLAGSVPRKGERGGNMYTEAFDVRDQQNKQQLWEAIVSGLDLFEDIFGYRSQSMIPPNYFWHPEFNRVVYEKGVRFFQGQRKMKSIDPDGNLSYISHKMGEKNSSGQIYTYRNVFFEPSLFRLGIGDPVGKALYDMSAAFMMNKPAVICSHRLNYIGYIDEKNRENSLKLLRSLLTQMLERWPDIEFMTSVELGQLIANETMNPQR
jgi:hypothetical protein